MPLQRPAQSAVMTVATPATIRQIPRITIAAKEVMMVSAGKITAAVAQTTNRIPIARKQVQ